MMSIMRLANKAGFSITKAVVGVEENYYYLVHDKFFHHAIVTEKSSGYDLELRLKGSVTLNYSDCSKEYLLEILMNIDRFLDDKPTEAKARNLEININGFSKDELKVGDVLNVNNDGKVDRYTIINPTDSNQFDLLNINDKYTPLGYKLDNPIECIKQYYKNKTDFISVSVTTLEENEAANKFAYDNGFRYEKTKSMTLAEIEELLGYKINLI